MNVAMNMLSKMVRCFLVGVIVLTGTGVVLNSVEGEAAETSEANILFILDASGSMWGRIKETEKIVIAKDVLTHLIQELPDNFNIGLEVYGHRSKGDCNDIELLVPVGKGDKDSLLKQIQSINPKGKTPITKSVELAAKQLETIEEETTIVLVSDGKETCEGDPCVFVKTLKEKGIRFTMHVVGFDVTSEEKAQLACIAEAGGGRYFTAQNATQLQEAFTEVKTEVIKKAEEKAEPEKKVKKKRVVKLLPSVGYITIPNVTIREVEVYSQEADGKNQYSEGFIGWISPKETTLEVLAGTYKLKFGNQFFVESVKVEAGETVEILLGTITISNLTGRDVEVHSQESSGKDQYSDGFVGWITPKAMVLEVPAGTYKLKFGNNFFVEGIEVGAGDPIELQIGAISISNPDSDFEVYTQNSDGKNQYSDGFVGWITAQSTTLEVPAGIYKLKIGKQFMENIVVEAGEELVLE